MSVSNGQAANAATFNGAFVSKTADSSTNGVLTQEKESVLKEIATPTTPGSGYGKIYFKSDGKLYQLNDAGIETQVGSGSSGSSGINFISNGGAEDNNTTGWAVYFDAAGTSPVDGTGGTANVTISATATTPLIGTYSFLMAKDAANRQGQGWSYAFTIDTAYRAKVLQISFDYLVNSGTFSAGTPTADSDVTIWIYDVTNAQLIQPSNYKLLGNSTSLTTRYSATFQSASNSSSYRLIFHVGSTSASAYTLEVDGISVSPSVYVYGTPVTDWQSYTPTTQGLGTISAVAMYWRRVGSNVEIMGNLTTGTVTASEAQIGLPSGLTSSPNISTIQMAGTVLLGASTSNYRNLLIETSKTYLTVGVASASSQLTKQLGTTFANTTILSFQASVQVTGWSSNVQISSDTDTRVVDFVGSAGSGQVLTANTTNITVSTVKDSHGVWGGSSYTVPVSGDYIVAGSLQANGAQTVQVYRNGAAITAGTWSTAATSQAGAGSVLVPNCVAGDILSIRSTTSVTVTVAYLSISRLSGPSVIAATESVNASYYLSANFAASTTVPINFDTREFDSHNAVTTSATAWRFTAPVNGTFQVNVFGFATAANLTLFIYKNGSNYKYFAQSQTATYATTGATLIKLNAGEYIDIRPSSAFTMYGGSLTSGNASHVSIYRVGN